MRHAILLASLLARFAHGLRTRPQCCPLTQHSALNTGIVNNQRKLIWRFWVSSATRFSDRPDGDISVPICWLVKGLRSEPSRVEGTPNVPKSGGKWRFFHVIPAFVQWCKGRGETRHQSRAGRLVDCNPHVVAHFCSLRKRSDDPRDVAARAVQRFRLTLSLIIPDKAGSDARLKTRYRLMSQQANGLRDAFFSQMAQRSTFGSWRS